MVFIGVEIPQNPAKSLSNMDSPFIYINIK
jgi:hypothetical protein